MLIPIVSIAVKFESANVDSYSINGSNIWMCDVDFYCKKAVTFVCANFVYCCNNC